MREQFFDSGAQNWYELINHITFPTCFIKLEREVAKALIDENVNFQTLRSTLIYIQIKIINYYHLKIK